jgi:hypothetical protein
MRLPRFSVRTLLIAVSVVALLIWGAMMGARSYTFCRLAREYGANERGWREIASRNRQPEDKQFQSECVQYFALLAVKYRRAMWHPWSPVAPDPHAPGVNDWLEQESGAKKVITDPHTPAAPSAPE